MYYSVLHEEVDTCPHCGSSAIVVHYITYYKVRCDSSHCAACGGSSPTIQGAKDLWNKRQPHVG